MIKSQVCIQYFDKEAKIKVRIQYYEEEARENNTVFKKKIKI